MTLESSGRKAGRELNRSAQELLETGTLPRYAGLESLESSRDLESLQRLESLPHLECLSHLRRPAEKVSVADGAAEKVSVVDGAAVRR